MARVLIVEDEPVIAMMLDDWLSDLGHVVIGIAASNSEAIAIIAGQQPECAIIDYLLTDGAAIALIAELKRRDVPFVVLTGAAAEEVEALCCGVAVLCKPVRFDHLHDAVTGLYRCPPAEVVLSPLHDVR